jgi:CubicO group peptidase (beta-lactamase class C family)
MTRRLILGVALATVVGWSLQAAPPPAVSPQGSSALSAFLEATVDRGDVPGAVVLVTGRDGILYHEAFGMQDTAKRVPMAKDTIFRIASMTKPVTSLAVMMLVEEGKLGLKDDVSKYLPAWQAPKVIASVDAAKGTFTSRPAARAITIEHLLTHTSGIGYAWSDPGLNAIQRNAGTPDLELPLVADPGARFTYGASTRVLGQVVEKISGQTIDAFLQARILGPLGMTDTSFDVPAGKLGRLVTIHQRTDGKLVEQANPTPFVPTVRGDGGLNSTASDYSRFVRLLLNEGVLDGKRLVSAKTIREMTTNHLGGLKVERQPAADGNRSKPYPLGAGQDTWGLGFQLAARPETQTARGEGSYSWAGINNTHFWVDPTRQIGVVVLMQVLPFYDDRAIALLTGVEKLVNTHVK